MAIQWFALASALALAVVSSEGLNIWPMPKWVSYGGHQQAQTRCLSDRFALVTEGSKYADSQGILRDGFSRFVDVVRGAHAVRPNSPPNETSSAAVLQGISVIISSPNDELQYGIDESYNLSIPASGKDASFAHLEAQTVYGALHGLQTFSQLCHFNFITRAIEVHRVPWTIIDQPRFSYRGLLIDTSRHYLSLPVMKSVIDSMAYAKLNVLHWHIVDREAFPLEIPSYPKLWDGAYSVTERYTMLDAAEIVSYAKKRGINVLAELDVPGHASSWGNGYPALWPSRDCQEPLDISNEFTFEVIDGILSDFSKIFDYKLVHLGGDEVNTSCWTVVPRINKWLNEHKMNESDAYEYFVLRAQKIALSRGYEIVNWEETFNNFGNKLDRRTVVHNWLGTGVAERVVAAGLRCIVSNQDKWYLDHLYTTWDDFYLNEPLTNITDPKQQKLVLGGEVCMWGEEIDGSDIQQTIWPRAAAAAERLWTAYDKLAKEPKQVLGRLAHFRCLLNERGIGAGPLHGIGRSSPDGASSCYKQ